MSRWLQSPHDPSRWLRVMPAGRCDVHRTGAGFRWSFTPAGAYWASRVGSAATLQEAQKMAEAIGNPLVRRSNKDIFPAMKLSGPRVVGVFPPSQAGMLAAQAVSRGIVAKGYRAVIETADEGIYVGITPKVYRKKKNPYLLPGKIGFVPGVVYADKAARNRVMAIAAKLKLTQNQRWKVENDWWISGRDSQWHRSRYSVGKLIDAVEKDPSLAMTRYRAADVRTPYGTYRQRYFVVARRPRVKYPENVVEGMVSYPASEEDRQRYYDANAVAKARAERKVQALLYTANREKVKKRKERVLASRGKPLKLYGIKYPDWVDPIELQRAKATRRTREIRAFASKFEKAIKRPAPARFTAREKSRERARLRKELGPLAHVLEYKIDVPEGPAVRPKAPEPEYAGIKVDVPGTVQSKAMIPFDPEYARMAGIKIDVPETIPPKPVAIRTAPTKEARIAAARRSVEQEMAGESRLGALGAIARRAEGRRVLEEMRGSRVDPSRYQRARKQEAEKIVGAAMRAFMMPKNIPASGVNPWLCVHCHRQRRMTRSVRPLCNPCYQMVSNFLKWDNPYTRTQKRALQRLRSAILQLERRWASGLTMVARGETPARAAVLARIKDADREFSRALVTIMKANRGAAQTGRKDMVTLPWAGLEVQPPKRGNPSALVVVNPKKKRDPMMASAGDVFYMDTHSFEDWYPGQPGQAIRKVKVLERYTSVGNQTKLRIQIMEGPEKGRIITGSGPGSLWRTRREWNPRSRANPEKRVKADGAVQLYKTFHGAAPKGYIALDVPDDASDKLVLVGQAQNITYMTPKWSQRAYDNGKQRILWDHKLGEHEGKRRTAKSYIVWDEGKKRFYLAPPVRGGDLGFKASHGIVG